jgi:tetratricopeptide (TPR) repeat protein
MQSRWPSIIQADIEQQESDLQEIANDLARLRRTLDELENQITVHGYADVPIEKLEHQREIRERIAKLEGNRQAVEAELNAFKMELEQAWTDQQKRLKLESKDFNSDELPRVIEETEALIRGGHYDLKPFLAQLRHELAELAEYRGDSEKAIRSWELAAELYREGGEDTRFLMVQHHLVDLLTSQGDSYYDEDKLGPALAKYLHARDYSLNVENREAETRVCGKLARLYEAQGNYQNALDFRLERLDGLVQMERAKDIYSELYLTQRLCHKFRHIKTAQPWIRKAYRLAERLFVEKWDLSGIQTLIAMAEEFSLKDLRENAQEAMEFVKEQIRKHEMELNTERRSYG